MKTNAKVIYASELILAVYLIWLKLNMGNVSNLLKNITALIVFSVLVIILLAFFGIEKDKNYLKGSSARIVITGLMVFFLITYALGIILGFRRGFLYHDLFSFIKNIAFVLVITVEIEIIRYIVAKKCFQNEKLLVVFTVLSSIYNVFMEMNMGVLTTSEDKFIFLSTIIFPIMASEALCSFMTYKTGMLSSLIYKLVINLYIYILPIVPDLGDYIYSVANILLPFILYNTLNKMIIKYDKEKQQLKKINRVVFVTPLVVLFIILVILVSGIFNHKLIAVASNSMVPMYSRGDAVIYEKVNVESLEVGDILAFKKDDIIVTHRIVKIWKRGDQYFFTTKGDNNNGNDSYMPKEADVLGRVRLSFKYIGYPTVLINEFFGKE